MIYRPVKRDISIAKVKIRMYWLSLKAKEKCRGVLVRAIKRLKHVVPLYFSLGGLDESERLPALPDSLPQEIERILATIAGCEI